MAGRMGTDTVTVKNLEVISITDDGVLLIKGLVPGFVSNYVVVKKVGENKKHVDLYSEPQETPVQETQTAPVEEAPKEEEQPAQEVAPQESAPEVSETKEIKEEVIEDAKS